MHLLKSAALAAAAMTFSVVPARAAIVMIDDFNTNEGHFTQDPDASGSTAGLSETADGVGPSTADRVTSPATDLYEGAGAEKLVLVSGSYFNTTTPATRTGFVVRFLSGGGTPANNVSLNNSGYVGIWAKTSQTGVQIAPAFDDSTSLERAAYQDLIPDGEYHLYNFNLAATNFVRVAGSGTTSASTLDTSTVTTDALFINSPGNQPGNVTLFLDAYQYNPDGPVPIPEPAAAGLLGLAGLALAARRGRRVR